MRVSLTKLDIPWNKSKCFNHHEQYVLKGSNEKENSNPFKVCHCCLSLELRLSSQPEGATFRIHPPRHGPRRNVDMLLLSRRTGETIQIGDDITVTVLQVNGNQVRIGIVTPGLFLKMIYT